MSPDSYSSFPSSLRLVVLRHPSPSSENSMIMSMSTNGFSAVVNMSACPPPPHGLGAGRTPALTVSFTVTVTVTVTQCTGDGVFDSSLGGRLVSSRCPT
jgi:hypothetical protein